MRDVKESIIELLRDDEEYYNGTGRNFPSVSNISKMTKTPRVYLDWMDGKEEKEFNINFVIGGAIHTMVLEGQEKFDEMYTIIDQDDKGKPVLSRAANFYKNHESPKDRILLLKEFDNIKWLASRLHEASEYDENVLQCVSPFMGEAEVPNIHEIFGVTWKMKVDKLTDEFVYDLKTTADLDTFMYNAKKYNYDAQAALYSVAFDRPMRFVVIEKSTGRVGVFTCDDSFIMSGLNKLEEASAFYKEWIEPVRLGKTKPEDMAYGSLITHINLI